MLTSVHRPYCSFVRWDGELCRQHWTVCRSMKTAYGPPLSVLKKQFPQNGVRRTSQLSNFNKTRVSSQMQKMKYNNVYFFPRGEKRDLHVRPTKMALSKRKRNYVIRMDGFILRRLFCADCVVETGNTVTIH